MYEVQPVPTINAYRFVNGSEIPKVERWTIRGRANDARLSY